MKREPPRTRLRAFTLIEMVSSLAVASIIVLGLASAMRIGAMALPGAGGQSTAAELDTVRALDQIESELLTAHAVYEASGTALEFLAADVTGDGLPDLVRYEWSGVDLAPLVRTVNGASASSIAADVTGFSAGPASDSDTSLSPSVAELLDADSDLLAVARTDVSGEDTRAVSESTGPAVGARGLESAVILATVVTPEVPVDVTQWVPSLLRLKGSAIGSSFGGIEVRICGVNPDLTPDTSVVYASEQFSERQLAGAGFDWITIEFGAARNVPAGEPVAIVLVTSEATEGGSFLYSVDEVDASTARLLESKDGAKSWGAIKGTLEHQLFGDLTTGVLAASTAGTRTISCTLHIDGGSAVVVSIPLYNCEYTP